MASSIAPAREAKAACARSTQARGTRHRAHGARKRAEAAIGCVWHRMALKWRNVSENENIGMKRRKSAAKWQSALIGIMAAAASKKRNGSSNENNRNRGSSESDHGESEMKYRKWRKYESGVMKISTKK
jgi:hypothetical protein